LCSIPNFNRYLYINFEIMLNSMLLEKELETFFDGMKPSDHALLFYDSQESKHRILYNYLKDGLEKGKGIVYICSEEKPGQIRRGLRGFGIDVEPNERSGNLLIKNFDEWYIEDGRVEILKIINHWNETYNRFNEKGLGMRVAGETSCFFQQNKVRELLRYEYALHRVVSTPIEVLCAYNIQTIIKTGYIDMIMPLVRAHGKAIFTSREGSVVIEPETVEDTDVEKLLEIEI
jgi:hypothetical protein